ncbi:MAG: toxin, partial [Proteobacteria bacterium]
RTVTWFHTGAWLERERLELALAREYYDQDPQAPLLRDTIIPVGLTAREEREAARALRGRVLRQEIYAEDGTPQSVHPYSVSERNYETRLLQRAQAETHAVFFVHPRETVDLHYERNPADPRTQHELVLEVDDFGNVTRSAGLTYPRRSPVEPEQGRLWATVTDRSFANRPTETAWYRVGVPIETTTRELTGLTAPASGLLSGADVRAAVASAAEIPYEATADGTNIETRVIERERTLYSRDDLQGALPLGQIESLALPYESYRQAFTPGLLAQIYGGRVDAAMLQSEGGYVRQDGAWWAPSGRVEYDAARFYLPRRALDPFGHAFSVDYDAYALLPIEATDPLGNVTTAQSDYRVLAPALLSDPNENRTAVELDALGMVVKTAVMGKAGEGDTLAEPTTRVEYDLDQFREHGKPVFVHTFARERHGADNPRWQETYSYSDGSGREVMKKVQAEPGPVPVLSAGGHLLRNPDGTPQTRHEDHRWIGTGRTVFDNKGNPVKTYEPFFSDTSGYEDEDELVEWGVTPVLRYDPLGRLVRTDLPNGTVALVVFDAWRRESWDESDTVDGTPWLAAKQAGTLAEQRAASLALAHTSTPSISHLDGLGRMFLAVADNGPAGQYQTRIALDVEGNQRSVTDARGVPVLQQLFDMLGRRIDADSVDAGHKTTLLDVVDKPTRAWTARGHAVRHVYDALQRHTHVFVRDGASPEQLVQRTVYGEAHPQALQRNLRGRGYALFDGAGVVTNARYDFKGNAIESVRRLACEYKATPDWAPLSSLTVVADIELAAEPLLEAETFTTATAYDALSRVISGTTPDGSETRPTYNEANLLEKVEVRTRGAAAWTTFVADIDYNARGQRTRLQRGNGATTTYEYDDETFRLIRQRTTRASDGAVLQDLTYTHDPVGNIVQIDDAVSFGNSAVPANGLYEYDALYQLTKAEGREHPGQQPTNTDPALLRVDHPNDMQGLRRYREQYVYDEVGNILRMAHQPLGPGGSGWTRRYEYASDS